MSTKPLPDFRAYTIVKREGQKDIWIPLGAAFLHQDGAGMNILLQATPLDGKLVLRPFDNEGRKEPSVQSDRR
jgi:hypothetical protein